MPEPSKQFTLPVPVKERPHWRIAIRPTDFMVDRIPNVKNCWELIETRRVSLRGWDYPHITSKNKSTGNDWIASWFTHENYDEYWRLYQSAQFLHLFSFWEDSHIDISAARLRRVFMPENFKPSGVIEIFGLVYTVTEVFEFASRLAQAGVLGNSAVISVKLIGVANRILWAEDFNRVWHSFYVASENEFERQVSVPVSELIARSPELALNVAFEFFERFNWTDPTKEIFVEQQRKLLEKKL